MAKFDPQTDFVKYSGAKSESQSTLGKITSGSEDLTAPKPADDQQTSTTSQTTSIDWGLSAPKNSMSRGTKVGLLAVMLLVSALGYIIYDRISNAEPNAQQADPFAEMVPEELQSTEQEPETLSNFSGFTNQHEPELAQGVQNSDFNQHFGQVEPAAEVRAQPELLQTNEFAVAGHQAEAKQDFSKTSQDSEPHVFQPPEKLSQDFAQSSPQAETSHTNTPDFQDPFASSDSLSTVNSSQNSEPSFQHHKDSEFPDPFATKVEDGSTADPQLTNQEVQYPDPNQFEAFNKQPTALTVSSHDSAAQADEQGPLIGQPTLVKQDAPLMSAQQTQDPFATQQPIEQKFQQPQPIVESESQKAPLSMAANDDRFSGFRPIETKIQKVESTTIVTSGAESVSQPEIRIASAAKEQEYFDPNFSKTTSETTPRVLQQDSSPSFQRSPAPNQMDPLGADPFKSEEFRQQQTKQNVAQPEFTNSFSTDHAGAENVRIYVVQMNDNFWSIAKKEYGFAEYYQALFQYNQHRISNPKKIRPGMKVLIPAAEVLEKQYAKLFPKSFRGHGDKPIFPRDQQSLPGFYLSPQGEPMYRVGAEDTLSAIAHKHLGRARRWVQIYSMNRNVLPDPNRLKIGTVLKLPADASRVEVVKTPQMFR